MNITDLPTLNALLNAITATFLYLGYKKIKAGRQDSHKKFMIAALISSALFLTTYLIYHYNAGSVPYPYFDWTRIVYFAILIPHVILAGLMVPFILIAVYHAFKGNFQKHTRYTRWVFPVWMFVSISGIVIYIMLYLF